MTEIDKTTSGQIAKHTPGPWKRGWRIIRVDVIPHEGSDQL